MAIGPITNLESEMTNQSIRITINSNMELTFVVASDGIILMATETETQSALASNFNQEELL